MTHPEDTQHGGSGSAGGTGGSGGPAAEERLERAVRAAESALIEFEIAVETFRIEVENFSRLHERQLGPLYTRLEELDAQIAEAVAARTGDPEDLRRAEQARALVTPMPQVSDLFQGWLDSGGFSEEAAAMLTGQSVQPPPKVRPSEEARAVYRELVRKAHPDLAREETERERRDAFLARVNKAYSRGDVDALRALAEEWERDEAAGEADPGAGRSRAEELYDRLEWLARRKELLAEAAESLEDSAIGQMLKLAPEDPDGLLAEVAEDLRGKVAAREKELAGLLGG